MNHATTFDETSIAGQFRKVRAFTDRIVEPLSPEDCMVQSMDDVSPARWHIAHTTWFFETFVLKDHSDYVDYDPQFNYLFNSYYNTIGKQFPRPQRGFISRPGLSEIKQYRAHVDESLQRFLQKGNYDANVLRTIEVGLHHEQQHQELMLTDIKHVLSCNPTLPKYSDVPFDRDGVVENDWEAIDEGLHSIGYDGDGFSFDNESPVHQVFLPAGKISKQLVTCGEYLKFIEDGGYQRPNHWLAAGWSTVNESGWDAPLYWVKRDDGWYQFTLGGLQPVNPNWPVSHVSYYEADAFARWAGCRLPTEFEWEVASNKFAETSLDNEPFADVLSDGGLTIHPTRSPQSMMGGLWQWTSSNYGAYPGYKPPEGAIGEYNGKFMCNQYVLRGGSVATSSDHIRNTYRNFFPAHSRWQFFGIRLAK